MPHVIAEPCIGAVDCACAAVCPVDGIHPTPEEAAFELEDMCYINPACCIDCGLCVDECSAGAVFAEEDLPEQWQSYILRNAEYYERQ